MNARMLLPFSKTLLWFPLAFSLTWANGFGAPRFQPTGLRCEYLTHPTALDQTRPRLSWVVDAGKNRGVRQSAYRILVASRPELLEWDQGDMWDSGKTISDESIQLVYQGHPLVSEERYFWKVKLWDERGSASPWSLPAQWTMGLLKPSDWQAKWIGDDGGADDQTASELMKPAPFFRKAFTVHKSIKRAMVFASALGLYELHLNGKPV